MKPVSAVLAPVVLLELPGASTSNRPPGHDRDATRTGCAPVISAHPPAGTPPRDTRFRLEQLDERVVLLRWQARVAVDVDDVVKLMRALEASVPGGRVHMLVELNGMVTVERQAFVLLAASLGAEAVAFVGTCPVERVLVAHFDAVHRPKYPVGYFGERSRALEWLNETAHAAAART